MILSKQLRAILGITTSVATCAPHFILTQAMAAQDLPKRLDVEGEPIAVGLIVNMVDQRVRKLTPDFTTYTLAKMGLWALTQNHGPRTGTEHPCERHWTGTNVAKTYDKATKTLPSKRRATVLKRGANLSDITAALGYFLDCARRKRDS